MLNFGFDKIRRVASTCIIFNTFFFAGYLIFNPLLDVDPLSLLAKVQLAFHPICVWNRGDRASARNPASNVKSS